MTDDEHRRDDFDDDAFWRQARRLVGRLPFVKRAAALYYCARDPDTPLWVKAAILAALVYFVTPVDAVPDAVPIAGFGDDAGVVFTALTLASAYVTDEHRARAEAAFS